MNGGIVLPSIRKSNHLQIGHMNEPKNTEIGPGDERAIEGESDGRKEQGAVQLSPGPHPIRTRTGSEQDSRTSEGLFTGSISLADAPDRARA